MVVHSVSIAWHADRYCVIPFDDLTTPTFLYFLLSIIMHKINAVNAQYQEFLWTRVKALEIRKTPGENVDTVVSLLNAG